MAWLEITVNTANRDVEAVAVALTAAGFSDLVLEDQQELETFLDQNRAYWDYIDETLQQSLQGLSRIKLYLEEQDNDSLNVLKQLAQDQGLFLEITPLAEVNWEESWKENYPPVEVGSRLTVLPYWLAETDLSGRLPVILDPGLTFGTGAHPSTQMVMEGMEDLVKPGCACLDLGSGSGILSIAALRLGAGSAIGVDIDPKAEDMARENAAYNGFKAPEFTALTGNVTTDRPLMHRLSQGRYDLVFVNIVADVIIGLAPVLPVFLQPESILICSGILHDRLGEVTTALEHAGLEVTSVRAGEDWRCITAQRRNGYDTLPHP